MYCQLLNSNSSPILELSIKFVSEICYENINKPLDGAYLADFGIDITYYYLVLKVKLHKTAQFL